jgi:hypothetical protein
MALVSQGNAYGFVAFGSFWGYFSGPLNGLKPRYSAILVWCGAVGNVLSHSQRLRETLLTPSLRAASGWKLLS